MNENFSDIVRFYPIFKPVLHYAIPMQVRVESITPSGMGIADFQAFLARTVYFAVADTDITGPQGATYHTVSKAPELRLVPSKDINGLIYKATLSFSFENLSAEGKAYLKAMGALGTYDVLVERANGEFALLRSLPNTSLFAQEEETKKDCVVKAKIEMKTLGLTPIIL